MLADLLWRWIAEPIMRRLSIAGYSEAMSHVGLWLIRFTPRFFYRWPPEPRIAGSPQAEAYEAAVQAAAARFVARLKP